MNVANFSPVRQEHYRVGVDAGRYQELLNSNTPQFGGNGRHYGTIESYAVRVNGFDNSIELTLEPNSAVYFKKKDFSLTINSKFKSLEEENNHTNLSTVEAKKVVTKIIDSKTTGKNLFTEDHMNKKFVPEELTNLIESDESVEESIRIKNEEILNNISKENENIEKFEISENKVEINNSETNSDENKHRKRGRPRKPIDPEAANKPKLPRGRPRKPIDPEAANKPKLPRGRPRKPIDPEAANKPKLPRGRPRKPIDPELLNKPKLPRGRPKKQTGNL